MFFLRKTGPVIRERSEHCVSRANIDEDALKVLYRLSTAGHIAYLVGGSVRDLLLGRRPKDFDVGTDARPNEIRKIFRNCFLIGRRFRLAHIIFGKKVIETSTFRRQPEENETTDGLYQAEDNTFGTPEEDAKRRDFTVNGLFYDIKTFSVIDYVGGLKDLDKRILRCIGDPNIRFREDPVRMMRAVKFAARLDFTIDRASRKAILKHHADILKASTPRICEEIYRLFTYNRSREAFHLLWEFELLGDLLPELAEHIHHSGSKHAPLWNILHTLDNDIVAETASNGLRTACLFYTLFAEHLKREQAQPHAPHNRVFHHHIARAALASVSERLHIPKATFFTAVALLDFQRRFDEPPVRGARRFAQFVRHPDFLEALALYRIVQTATSNDLSRAKAWETFYEEERAHAHHAHHAQAHHAPAHHGHEGHAHHDRAKPEHAPHVQAKQAEEPFTVVVEDGPGEAPGFRRKRRRNRHRKPLAHPPPHHPHAQHAEASPAEPPHHHTPADVVPPEVEREPAP